MGVHPSTSHTHPVRLSYLPPILKAQTQLEKLIMLALEMESQHTVHPSILPITALMLGHCHTITQATTHALKLVHVQMCHPYPAGKLRIGFPCLQQPASVQESTPAHVFSAAGSFLLQGNKVGGIAKDQYLFWCNRRVNRTVFILDSENCSFLPHLLAIYKRNLN